MEICLTDGIKGRAFRVELPEVFQWEAGVIRLAHLIQKECSLLLHLLNVETIKAVVEYLRGL